MVLKTLLVIAAIAVIVLAVMLINQKQKVASALESIEKDKKALDDKEKFSTKKQKLKQ